MLTFMLLLNYETQEEFEAEILEVLESELVEIDESGRFGFDWSKEVGNRIFKIVAKGILDSPALGLISLSILASELRIHVDLVENAKENRGKDKQVDRVGGCLLAFAAGLSFERGYLGFISLVPKTELIDHYVEKYGFTQYGRQLAIDGEDAIKLIQKYL